MATVTLPRLSLGGVPFGREIDEAASRDLLDYALERGLTLIDTAEAYGGGNSRLARRNAYQIDDAREVSDEMHSSEKIIGRWLEARGCRDRMQICTKFNSGGRRDQVKRALAGSLERLKTDYVDVYMLHCPYPDVPIRETLEALTEEVQAGRIRAIGCSNFTLAQLTEAQETAIAHGLQRMGATQPSFSLAEASIRQDFLPYCIAHDIATMTYSPLAAGFLTGKYSPQGEIPKGTRFDISPAHTKVFFSERNFRILENLKALSTESGESMARLAMAWVLHQPGVTSILVGARTRAHIDNALDALERPVDAAWLDRMTAWLDA